MNTLKHILSSLLLLAAMQTMADQVTVAGIEVAPGGSAELVINYSTSATNITGYQMSLYLPEDVTLQKDDDGDYVYTLSSCHNKNHTFSVNEQADGGLMLVCYSLTKKTIATGSGELLRLPINVASTATGTLNAQFRNIKFSDTGSNVSQLGDVTVGITVRTSTPPELQDSQLTVADIEATSGGSAEIVINFSTSATDITGYQMSLYLPAGVTLQKDDDDDYVYTLSMRHNKNHTFSVNEQADGGLMLVCYSLTKKTIAARSGELLRLPINISATARDTLTAQLRTVKVSDTGSNVTQLEDVAFNIVCTSEVVKAEQTLSLTSLPAMTVGDAAYQLPATTDQGLPLTWKSGNTAVAAISNGKLTAKGEGMVVVTATQAGNDSYLPFERKFTLTVKTTEPVNPDPQPTVDVTDISGLNNVIYVEPMEVRTGTQTTILLKMKNAVPIRGFQFDLYLPEGVTVVKSAKGKIQGTLSAGRLPDEDEHTLTFSEQPDGAIRFLCSSEYEETFTGNDGEIATLLVNIADDMEEGDYPIQLKAMKLTETDISKFYETALVQSKLTVVSYVIGDINGDRVVDVSDYTGVANHIHGNTPVGFYAKAADVDKSGAIDVSDYTGIANIIHTGSIYGNSNHAPTKSLSPRRVNTDLCYYDNVIYISPFIAEIGSQAEISISMKNTAEIRGFQFDLYLPEGMTVAKSSKGRIQGSLSADRLPDEDEHELTFSEQPDGAVRFLCSSQYDETFTGNNGEIATLQVNVDESVAEGDYPILLKAMKLTESDIRNFYTTDEIETTVTLSYDPTTLINGLASGGSSKDAEVYDLAGRKVAKVAKKGVYIVGGRKLLKR